MSGSTGSNPVGGEGELVTTADASRAASGVDLRAHDCNAILRKVERAFGVTLNQTKQVHKRRSIGAPTDRGTWVRIEVRHPDKVSSQGFNGTELAGSLTGIAKPAWYASVEWQDDTTGLLWRADETELVIAAPIKPGGILTKDPQLPKSWWSTLNTSLDALAHADTIRAATLHTEPLTQARVSNEIQAVFGENIDTTVEGWAPAHADFTWANLTGPECWILDWEDWGLAPRGLDAAMLWAASLAVPDLAEQVYQARKSDLDSRDGQLMQLFFAAIIIGAPTDYSGPLLDPARAAAERILSST